MQVNKNLYGFDVNYKTISLLVLLAVLPNLLGMINLPTVWGFKIHIFQVAIFLAAATLGPLGGAVSGGFGSLYTAMTLGNPYIVVGNIILGVVVGYLVHRGWDLFPAVLAAWAVQMPWLWVTDVYLAGMPVQVVNTLVIALLISNMIWAAVARVAYKPIQRVIQG